MDNLSEQSASTTTKFDIRGAIRYDCYNSNLTIRAIAQKYNVNPRTVMKWKKRSSIEDKKRERKRKANPQQINFIKKLAVSKYTGEDGASTRLIAEKVRERYTTKEKQFSISSSTIHNILTKDLKLTPRKAKNTFLLTKKNKESRVEFAKYIKDKGIKGENIFFTDESRFLLSSPLNPITNQIRFSEEDTKKLKEGDPDIYEKLHRPLPKYSQGFMVAGGISYYGPGELIFCVGTMDTKCYKRTLNYYKDDINRLHPMLYFQQDNAACHTSKESMEFIKNEENFIRVLENWPPNSPDLSPIETVWAILKERISRIQFKTLDEMKEGLIKLWNRIPVKLCRKLVSSFDEKIKALGERGERVVLKPKKKKTKTKSGKYKKAIDIWNKKWDEDLDDEVDRVVFNDKTLKINQERAIREFKRRVKIENRRYKDILNEKYSTKIMKEAKADWWKLSKLEDDKKRLKNTHEDVINHLKSRIDEASGMNLENWYESLNRVLKLKMLRIGSISKKDLENDGTSICETRANEEDDVNDDEDDEDESDI
jgi:transposase